MFRMLSLLTATTLLAFALFAVPVKSWAAGLPKGVTIDLIAEYPSKTAGVAKILFRNMTIKPGSALSITVPAQSLCQATKGVLEVTSHVTDKTVIHKAGDRWDTTPGEKVTLANKGTVDHEHLFYTMIVKK